MEIDREAVLKVFQADSEDYFRVMEANLLQLENNPNDEEALHSVFRVAHTFKGDCSMLGFQKLTEIGHLLEDLLDQIQKKTIPVTKPLVSLLLASADLLRKMVRRAVAGKEKVTSEFSSIFERIQQELHAGVEVSRENSQPEMGQRTVSAEPLTTVDNTKTIRVDTEKLDRLLNLTGEVGIARGRFEQILIESGQPHLLEAHREAADLMMQLQDMVMRIRMVQVGPVFRQYIRQVRDLAEGHGKHARLVIEGADVEVDMTVTEHLKAPLTHLIRNAVDHGIEKPEERVAKGKDPTGYVRLRAFHEAGNIFIQVSDDGSGLDETRILEKARASGILTSDEQPTKEELDLLIFKPGFSTTDNVTDLSGRGVGMDVVRRNIEALRGSVSVRSEKDKGTTITLRLPLTLAIINAFGVGTGEESYLIPLDFVTECIEFPQAVASRSDGSGVINLRGEVLPFVRLRNFFSIPGEEDPRQHVLVVQYEGGRAGLVVDELYGESQIVIKPIGKLFQKLKGISGSAILGNGRVALILDVPAILQHVIEKEAQATVALQS